MSNGVRNGLFFLNVVYLKMQTPLLLIRISCVSWMKGAVFWIWFSSILLYCTVNLLQTSDGKRGNSCEPCSSATQTDLLSIPSAGMTHKSRTQEGVGWSKNFSLCRPAHKWSGQYPVQSFATLLARNTVPSPRTGMRAFLHFYNRLPSFGLSENLAQRKAKAVGQTWVIVLSMLVSAYVWLIWVSNRMRLLAWKKSVQYCKGLLVLVQKVWLKNICADSAIMPSSYMLLVIKDIENSDKCWTLYCPMHLNTMSDLFKGMPGE